MSRWEGEDTWPDHEERDRRLAALPGGRRMWFYCVLLTGLLVAGMVWLVYEAWRSGDGTFIGLAVIAAPPALCLGWVCWAGRSQLGRH